MTTCPECGRHNPPGTQFCTSCQAFLGWDDENGQDGQAGRGGQTARGEQRPRERGRSGPSGEEPPGGSPGSPDPVASPPRAPEAGEGSGRPSRAGGPGRAGTPPVPRPAPDAAPGTSPPASPPPPPAPPAVQPAAAPEPAAAAPRRPGDELSGGTGPRHHEEPPPSPPGRPAPQPPRTTRTCPRCRTVNPGDRRLCLGCGSVLNPAQTAGAPPAAGELPWWRRLFGARSERRRKAGSRPRHRVMSRPRLALPLVLLLLACLAWIFRAELAGAFDFARQSTGKPEALQVVRPTASSSAKGHAPAAAFDKLSNRYWAPERAGTFTGHYVRASFEKPVRLTKLLVTPGTSAKQDEYLKEARPSHLTLTLHKESGERSTKPIRLKDQAGDQSFDVRGSDVVQVTVAVEDAYGARPGRRPAIAELEFFGHR